jgi:hypothetical protein
MYNIIIYVLIAYTVYQVYLYNINWFHVDDNLITVTFLQKDVTINRFCAG